MRIAKIISIHAAIVPTRAPSGFLSLMMIYRGTLTAKVRIQCLVEHSGRFHVLSPLLRSYVFVSSFRYPGVLVAHQRPVLIAFVRRLQLCANGMAVTFVRTFSISVPLDLAGIVMRYCIINA